MPQVSTSMPSGTSISSQWSHLAALLTAKNSSMQSANEPTMIIARPPASNRVTRPPGRLLKVNSTQLPAITAVPPSLTMSVHFHMWNGLAMPRVEYRNTQATSARQETIKVERCNCSIRFYRNVVTAAAA